LEKAIGAATVPDKEEDAVQQVITSTAYGYEQLRAGYYFVKLEKNPATLCGFIQQGKSFTSVPAYSLSDHSGDYSSPTYGKEYVNLSRPRALGQDYEVLARSLMKDLNSTLEAAAK
jgi:hypothetical protein